MTDHLNRSQTPIKTSQQNK